LLLLFVYLRLIRLCMCFLWYIGILITLPACVSSCFLFLWSFSSVFPLFFVLGANAAKTFSNCPLDVTVTKFLPPHHPPPPCLSLYSVYLSVFCAGMTFLSVCFNSKFQIRCVACSQRNFSNVVYRFSHVQI